MSQIYIYQKLGYFWMINSEMVQNVSQQHLLFGGSCLISGVPVQH